MLKCPVCCGKSINMSAAYPLVCVDIPASDQLGYRRLMREMRVNFIQESIYDRKMLTLIKRVRCALNPQEFDCGMTGE